MFLLNRRAEGADRSPWGDFWFEPVGMTTAAGARVSSDVAMRLSAVYACVRILAETMAAFPVCVYKLRDDGGKEVLRDHWMSRLLRRPNRWQNGFEWREMLQGHLSLRGNAYCRIVANGRGEITELIPVAPDSVSIDVFDSGDYRYKIKSRDGGQEILPRGMVWHLRGLSSDGIRGLSPLELARESIGMGLAAQEYGARFFANDAKPGGWIKFPGAFKDKQARDVFRESWQATQSAGNRHKVAVLEHGMEYHEVGVTNKDAQFLELRQFQITDIARIFRVPPHMIADLSRSTNNNIEHQGLEFAANTMAPWAERWEASIENDLLTEEGVEIEFDFAGLMRGDQAARSSYYASGITNGWLTRNEARIAENLNPIEGLDDPLRPLNMTTEDDAEEAEDTAVGPAEDDSAETDGAEARLRAVVRSQAQRLARRIEKAGAVDENEVRVIAEALAVPVDRVVAWVGSHPVLPSGDQLAAELEVL